MMRAQWFLFVCIGVLVASVAQAETKLTPLKTGGGKTLESLKAKKEPKPAVAPSPAKKDEAKPAPKFTGPKAGWGIVSTATSIYAEDGQNQGKLSAGTLLSYSAVRQSSTCFVLVAKIQRQANQWEGPFLVESPDVVLFSGVLEEMPSQLITDLKAYYTLQGRMAARKEAIAEESQTKNPYFEGAKQAQAKYMESVEKATVMEQQANALKGSTKSKMLDSLRSLKYEQARLKTEADKEALSYKAWKEQHPPSPDLYLEDREYLALAVQLKAAKEKIKDVVVE